MFERDSTIWTPEGGYNAGVYPFDVLRMMLDGIEAVEGNGNACRIDCVPYSTYVRPTTHFIWANTFSNDLYLDWLLAQSK